MTKFSYMLMIHTDAYGNPGATIRQWWSSHGRRDVGPLGEDFPSTIYATGRRYKPNEDVILSDED